MDYINVYVHVVSAYVDSCCMPVGKDRKLGEKYCNVMNGLGFSSS